MVDVFPERFSEGGVPRKKSRSYRFCCAASRAWTTSVQVRGCGESEVLKERTPRVTAAVALPRTHWNSPLWSVGQSTASQPEI